MMFNLFYFSENEDVSTDGIWKTGLPNKIYKLIISWESQKCKNKIISGT